jgi:hypothetical protein
VRSTNNNLTLVDKATKFLCGDRSDFSYMYAGYEAILAKTEIRVNKDILIKKMIIAELIGELIGRALAEGILWLLNL